MLRLFLKRLSALLTLAACAALAVANWFVHQPRHWQQTQSSKLPDALALWIAPLGHATADVTDALGLTGQDVAATLPAPLATNRLVCAGLPKRLPGSAAPADITVLSKTGFLLGYSPSLRHPVWAAYKTFPALATTALPARPTTFRPDPEARNAPQHKEYAKSGYDRGHLVPNLAIASRHGKAAQEQTFLTSNICPQRPSLNQGPWYNVEYRISELWPDRYGDIWVIVGAVTAPDAKRLPSGVNIPAAFYQIVVSQEKTRLRAFAVYMPQNIRRRAYARGALVSIDELERLTGFDFLADLPDDVERSLEAATPTRLWPAGPVGAIKLLRERFRRYD